MATTATTPDQQSIDTFMSITGSSEPVAIHKLTEHGGNLNQAVDSHFTEGDTNIQETNIAAPLDDFMDIDEPSETTIRRPPFSPLIESENAPRIDDVISTLPENVPETRGTLSIDADADDFPSLRSSHDTHTIPSAPEVSDLPDYVIEEEMIQAAIVASKREAEISLPDDAMPQHRQSQSEDPEIAHAVFLSLKSAEQEKAAFGELESEAGPSETRVSKLVEDGETLASSNGKLVVGSSSIQDETEDADEQPLVRHRSRHMDPTQPQKANNPVDAEIDFQSEWVRISSEEHDEAVMLEAAMVGGVPEGAENRVPNSINRYTRNGFNRTDRPYTRSAARSAVRPPSPSLTAQRLIKEQQDDEYLAALQADREKELLEQAAREPAMEEERLKEEDAQRISWGGISSEEHDEAVMLEAAISGGVPEGAENRVPYSRNHYTRNGFNRTGRPYTRSAARSAVRRPSPSLTAQRLIREQQDDEYLAALQVDREKELLEQAAREAAMEEERLMEEDAQRKLEQEQEIERYLAAKEASLPQEPTSDDENAVTLLVRMPDGTRRGRGFLRSDKLQHLFDFIDVSRVIKPSTYRLVRLYPRRAFSDGESDLTLNELGLTSKQEALFLELI